MRWRNEPVVIKKRQVVVALGYRSIGKTEGETKKEERERESLLQVSLTARGRFVVGGDALRAPFVGVCWSGVQGKAPQEIAEDLQCLSPP